MATIKKYVTDQLDIFDKISKSLTNKVTYLENESIADKVSYVIQQPPTGIVAGSGNGSILGSYFCPTPTLNKFITLNNIISTNVLIRPKIKSKTLYGYNYETAGCNISLNPMNTKSGFSFYHNMIMVFKRIGDNKEQITNFTIFNNFVIEDTLYSYILSNSYNQGFTITKISNFGDVFFKQIEVNQYVEAHSEIPFDILIKAISPYKNLKNTYIGFRIKLDDGTEFDIKFLLYIKRVETAFGILIPPNKNGYKETYFFKTNRFETTSGIWYDIATMNKPKLKIDVEYSSLSQENRNYMKNILLYSSYKPIPMPLWAEQAILVERANYKNVIKVNRIPTQWSETMQLFCKTGETTGYIIDVVNINGDDNTITVKTRVLLEKGTQLYPVGMFFTKNDLNMSYNFINDTSLSISLIMKGFVYDI